MTSRNCRTSQRYSRAFLGISCCWADPPGTAHGSRFRLLWPSVCAGIDAEGVEHMNVIGTSLPSGVGVRCEGGRAPAGMMTRFYCWPPMASTTASCIASASARPPPRVSAATTSIKYGPYPASPPIRPRLNHRSGGGMGRVDPRGEQIGAIHADKGRSCLDRVARSGGMIHSGPATVGFSRKGRDS